MFADFKNVHEFWKCPNTSTVVHELQISILISKIFTDLKHDHAFPKMFVKSKKVRQIQ